jgi:2-phospho-L-lactate guanylyltransferase (CobY/MobA/RfbA family)
MLAGLLRRLGGMIRAGKHGWRWMVSHEVYAPVWPRSVHVVSQGRGDLGQRMQRQFRHPATGPCCALIGSDIPAITPADIASAFKALGESDFCFGPALDGGYWARRAGSARSRHRRCS